MIFPFPHVNRILVSFTRALWKLSDQELICLRICTPTYTVTNTCLRAEWYMHMGAHTYPQSVHSGSFKLVSVVELLIFSDRLSTAELLFLTQAFTRMLFYRAEDPAAISSNYDWVSICYLHMKEHKQQSTERGKMGLEKRSCSTEFHTDFIGWDLFYVTAEGHLYLQFPQSYRNHSSENKDR